jgi:cell division protein FtsZ
MTLSEVEILMQELGRHINDQTQILFGTSVDGRMGNRLSVTLISSLATEEETVAAATPRASVARPEPIPEPEPVAPPPPIWEQREEPPVAVDEPPVFADELIQVEEPEPAAGIEAEPALSTFAQEEPVIDEAPPPARLPLPKKKPVPFKEPKPVEEKKLHAKQEVLQFEPVTRGRFEKSEPTIVEGQDLDIPTFLRKNVRVK